MFNFLLFSAIVVAAIGAGYFLNKNKEDYSFFSFDHTTILRGIAILLVVWGHVGKENNIGSIQFIAGAGVSLFLICSGYGLEMSYKKNGLKDFWKKRIVGVIVPFYVISLAGYVINSLFIYRFSNLSLSGFLNILDFNSQWYISYLLICYVIYYFITRFIKDYKKKMFALIAAFCVWFIIDSLFFVSADAPFLRARQMGAFISGIVIAENRERSEKIIGKVWFLIPNLIGGVALTALSNLRVVKSLPIIVSNVLSLGTVVPLAFAVISASLLVKKAFLNKSLLFAGVISYEIFLVHSYSLKLTSREWYWVLFFFVFVTILSWALNCIWKKAKKKLIH